MRTIPSRFLPQSLFFLVFLLSICMGAQAAPTLYRADARPPAAVFEKGFEAKGQNVRLLDHVVGGSCDLPMGNPLASAFVATTSSQTEAIDIAVDQGVSAHTGSNYEVYVYEIDADVGFIDVDATFRAVEADTENYTAAQRAKIGAIRRRFENEREFVSYQIHPEQIVGVNIYNQDGHLLRTQGNPAYAPGVVRAVCGMDFDECIGGAPAVYWITSHGIMTASTHLELVPQGSILVTAGGSGSSNSSCSS